MATRKPRTKTARARAAREDARERILAAAHAAGLEVYGRPDVWGEQWEQDEDGRVRRTRPVLDNLPSAQVALTDLYNRVRAEQRHDLPTPARDLRLSPDDARMGRVQANGACGGGRRYVPAVLGQIGRLLRQRGYGPAHMGTYLLDRPAAYRAAEFNAIVTEPANAHEWVVLRFRTPQGGGEHIYAGVSRRFAPYDPDALAYDLRRLLAGEGIAKSALKNAANGTHADVAAAWHPGVKARIVYRGVSVVVELISETAITGAGRLAVTVSSADDTSGSVTVNAALQLWSGVSIGARKQAARVVHHGKDPVRFLRGLAQGFVEATKLAAPFAELWEDRDAALVAADDAGLHSAIRWLCGDVWAKRKDDTGKETLVQTHKGWLRVPGLKPGELSTVIRDAWAALVGARPEGEPSVRRSIAGIAHALAHAGLTAGLQEGQGQALQEAAEALLWARPLTALVWLGVRSKGSSKTRDAALELDAELARLHGRVADWEAAAAEARARGDAEDAADAAERAEYAAIIADSVEEQRR